MGPGTWMALCPEELRIWGICKKNNWDSMLEEGKRFLELAKARPVGVYEMCHTWWGSDGKVSIERNCLFLLMSKNLKLKKVIKSFVPEPISCFSDSYTRMNIMNFANVFLCLFHLFISWSYFWTLILHEWHSCKCVWLLHSCIKNILHN